MCIIERSAGCRPAHCKLARTYCRLGATRAELADFFEVSPLTIGIWIATAPLDVGRASGNCGNCANLEKPSKMGIGRADDFLAETCANLRKPFDATYPVSETAKTPQRSAENAGNAEIQKSRGKRASDGAVMAMQKIAENAENRPAVLPALPSRRMKPASAQDVGFLPYSM